MAKELKKQTLGYFDIVADVTVDDKCFSLGIAGKNNINWLQNIFNPKVETKDGKSMYMRFSSGYDSKKGKTIYAMSKKGTMIEVPFADRMNQNMIDLVDDKSFIRVGIGKKTEKNEETGKEYKAWEYNKYLDLFDAIAFLNQIMPLASTTKVRLQGRVRFNEYNNEVTRNYDLQSIYILTNNEDEGKEMPYKLSFTQNVLLTEGCVDDSKLDSEGLIEVNSKIYCVVSKNKVKSAQILPVKFVMKATDEQKKATYKRTVDKFLTVKGDTVRRINLDCVFESGYVASNVSEEDLPQEAIELIEDGLYSKEEVMKMYANKERVDRLVIVRPLIRKINDKPAVDYNDEEYTLDDLEGNEVEIIEEEQVQSDEEVDDLLDELENL